MRRLEFPAWCYPVFMLFGVLLALFIGGIFEKQTLNLEQQRYCEMVALNKAEPEYGWPDFKDSFDTECNPDGSVRDEAP